MPKPTWEVAITVEGEHVLTIGSNHLAGVENIDDYADTILTCAQHLVSFIGGETESEKFFREEEERTARNRDMWKGQCERQAEQLTAMHSLLREAQAALEPFASISDLVDAETEGLDNSDTFDLMFHDYLLDRLPLEDFRRAAAIRNMGGEG